MHPGHVSIAERIGQRMHCRGDACHRTEALLPPASGCVALDSQAPGRRIQHQGIVPQGHHANDHQHPTADDADEDKDKLFAASQ
jgi:hypothetical protein